MKIYRAEYPDGGGPFYKLDGTPRNPDGPVFNYNDNDPILYGADSMENLVKLITGYGFDINDFTIKIYYSDKIGHYNKHNGHVAFRR